LTWKGDTASVISVRVRLPLVLVLVLSTLLLGSADWPKWRARARSGIAPNLRAASLVHANVWRDEPKSPRLVDMSRLAGALRSVCGPMPRERSERYAGWITESAARHGEDPFLLAAIVHRMSRCRPDADTAEGVGLAAIQPEMYRENVRGHLLHYLVPDGAAWAVRDRSLPHMLSPGVLRNPQDNLEWAAALLAMWREQHATVDSKFEQIPHRHYLSHFVWGDSVKSDRAEDRIFTDRRRLLFNYGEPMAQPSVQFRGLAFAAPLEAAPRVVSSSPGASRDEGLRRHRGVDVEAVYGEPVLAMADGTVSFAGVDLPGISARLLAPTQMKRVPRRQMGHGGRFVCIDHAAALEDELFLRSCYMHLEQVYVRTGEAVQRGHGIGTVGRTGMKSSAPHLHLEIKSDKRLYDARDVVPGILVGEPPPELRRFRRSARMPAVWRP